MKKIYETPDISIMNLWSADIITDSPIGGGGGADIVTPDDEF